MGDHIRSAESIVSLPNTQLYLLLLTPHPRISESPHGSSGEAGTLYSTAGLRLHPTQILAVAAAASE
jgi:hypothetical protein